MRGESGTKEGRTAGSDAGLISEKREELEARERRGGPGMNVEKQVRETQEKAAAIRTVLD